MRRAASVLLIVVLLGCSGDDDPSSTGATDSSVDVVETATVASSIPEGTDEPDPIDELPELDPVEIGPPEPTTRTEELAQEIGDGSQFTVQQAVDAFALLDPDMPGATPSDLPPGDGLDPTWTLALVREAYEQLDDEQRAVVDAAVSDTPVTGAIDANGEIIEDVTADGFSSGFAPDRSPAPQPIRDRYFRLFVETYKRWKAHRPNDWNAYTRFEVKLVETVPGSGMATTAVGAPTCTIEVARNYWQADRTDDYIAFFFAHEMFHCWQAVHGSIVKPLWILQGSADWAAADLFRSLFSADPESPLRLGWYTDPAVELAGREYSTWSLFELAHSKGRDIYALVKQMINSPRGTSTEQYLAMGGMDQLRFRMAWPSTAHRSTQYDETWRHPWPGPEPDLGPHNLAMRTEVFGLGRGELRFSGKWIHPNVIVPFDVDDVQIVTMTPKGGPVTTVADGRTVTVADGRSARFCLSPDGCRCPNSTGPRLLQVSGYELLVSMAASRRPSVVQFLDERWDPRRECEQPQEDTHRGRSHGDPHLETFDGLGFNAMALGEFVLSRDPDGGFEVQTRHVPIGIPGVSNVGAVALGTDGHRATFTWPDLSEEEVVVRVDGVVTTAADFVFGDVSVVKTGPADFTATWPDGTVVELRGGLGFFVDVVASDARARRTVGLLGSVDDDLRNDTLYPDGTVATDEELVGSEAPYVVAWQVDDATTMFDYEDGESWETFRVPFPDDIPLLEVDERHVEMCEEALGDDATSFEIESCAFDVAVTGDEEYVETYVEVSDARVADQVFVPDQRPVDDDEVIIFDDTTTTLGESPEAAAGEPTLSLAGDLVAPYALPSGGQVLELRGSFSAAEGTMVVVRVDSCPGGDTSLSVTITNGTTGTSGYVFVCGPGSSAGDGAVEGEGYVWLPMEATYEVLVESTSEQPSFVRVEVFADPTPTIVDDVEEPVELAGVGDTAVYPFGSDAFTYTAEGLDVACGVVAYGAPALGDPGPWTLPACTHPEGGTVAVGDADAFIPLVVFLRTDDEVTVTLTKNE